MYVCLCVCVYVSVLMVVVVVWVVCICVFRFVQLFFLSLALTINDSADSSSMKHSVHTNPSISAMVEVEAKYLHEYSSTYSTTHEYCTI